MKYTRGNYSQTIYRGYAIASPEGKWYEEENSLLPKMFDTKNEAKEFITYNPQFKLFTIFQIRVGAE